MQLSANFAVYKQPDAFSVRNKNDEPIGRLLGDGTTLSFGITGNQRLQVLGSDLNDIILCIEIRKDLYENSYGK